MKNKLFLPLVLIAMIALVASCATSKRFGCPSVAKSTTVQKHKA